MEKLFWALFDQLDINRLEFVVWFFVALVLLIFLFGSTIIIAVRIKHNSESNNWKVPFFVCFGILLLILLEIPLRLIYYEANGTCKDRDQIALLQNTEDSPEFILYNQHYTLPCPLHEFIDHGWDELLIEKSIVDIHDLFKDTSDTVAIELPTSYGFLTLVVKYERETEMRLSEGMVIAALYASKTNQVQLYSSPNCNAFVTKNGITENTSFHKASQLMGKNTHGEYMIIEKNQNIDIFYDETFGNFIVFSTNLFEDHFVIRSTGFGPCSFWIEHKDGSKRDDLIHYSFNANKHMITKPLSLWAVRGIIYLSLLCLIIIVFLFIHISRKCSPQRNDA